MTDIAAADVKKLRDATGAGMMECKKALQETGGDMDKAIEHLRVSGAAKAAKRGADRTASNGLVAADGNAIIELLCETDFVAKNADFEALAARIAAAVKAGRPADAAAAAGLSLEDGTTVEQAVSHLAGVIGEKLELGRVAVLAEPTCIYLHRRSSDLPPQVGVMVSYSGSEEAAKDTAQQIAAMMPSYLSRDDVPADVLDSERRIAEASAREEGKPEAALGKIVEGRVIGFYKQAVLLDQPFVKDNKQSVAQVLAAAGTTVSAFVRFEVGKH